MRNSTVCDTKIIHRCRIFGIAVDVGSLVYTLKKVLALSRNIIKLQ